MDSPSDLFRQQLSQLCPFGLYGSPPGNTTTDPHYPGGSSPSYPLISPLLHHNSATQRWGGYRHQAGFSPGSLLNKKLDEEVAEEMEQLMGRREVATGVAPVSKIKSGSARRSLAPDAEEWDQDTLREKRQRMDRVVRKERGMDGEGNNERKNAAGMVRGERRLDEDGKRKGSREGKQQERQKLKLQLEETRDKLLDLQRKLCRAYGEHGTTEERRQEDGEEEGVIDMDEVADTFSEEEMDEPAFPSELTPPLHASNKNKGDRGVNSGVFPGSNMDLDVGLDGGEVWLGCSFIRGQWESFGEGQKFAQALKQELASAVARVIDRVVRLYVETDAPLMSGPLTAEENPTRPTGGPNPVDTQRPNGAAKQLEHLDALPLVSSRPQDKRMALNQGAQTNPLLPRPSPSLLPLPQHSLPALLPPRSKDPFLPSYPPAPAPPLPLPLLQYTMQHLFARSLSNLPLHKDCLSNEPFLEFRTHNPSFPPLPLLGQLEPSMVDRGRDGGMRGGGGASGADGGDASLYLGPGSEGLSPCHLKKAKLMFFYARYPSSSTLKTYFPDVKFNRCVTSQLIKWFSNFREFFYIQMERFARQAAREGLPTARERALRLGRDSELYRILNMHYNKSNDYQVPDRFVEVSELALREFFTAIHSGRDVDPCWKKSIYKIICKLDSPVPDSFRLPGCPMETHRLA